jgi:hypothetical protein
VIDTPAQIAGHLRNGQVARCVCRGYTLSAAEAVDADPQCPMCEEYGQFVPHTPKVSLAERWGADLAKGGFWPVFAVLTEHTAALGLKPSDVGLMAAFANYGHGPAHPVFPRFADVAAQMDCSERSVRQHVNRWVKLGLWEKQHRRRANGWNSTCELTHVGLSQALRLLAANAAAGQEPTTGLEDLLTRLRDQRQKTTPTSGKKRHGPAAYSAAPNQAQLNQAQLNQELFREEVGLPTYDFSSVDEGAPF